MPPPHKYALRGTGVSFILSVANAMHCNLKAARCRASKFAQSTGDLYLSNTLGRGKALYIHLYYFTI